MHLHFSSLISQRCTIHYYSEVKQSSQHKSCITTNSRECLLGPNRQIPWLLHQEQQGSLPLTPLFPHTCPALIPLSPLWKRGRISDTRAPHTSNPGQLFLINVWWVFMLWWREGGQTSRWSRAPNCAQCTSIYMCVCRELSHVQRRMVLVIFSPEMFINGVFSLVHVTPSLHQVFAQLVPTQKKNCLTSGPFCAPYSAAENGVWWYFSASVLLTLVLFQGHWGHFGDIVR